MSGNVKHADMEGIGMSPVGEWSCKSKIKGMFTCHLSTVVAAILRGDNLTCMRWPTNNLRHLISEGCLGQPCLILYSIQSYSVLPLTPLSFIRLTMCGQNNVGANRGIWGGKWLLSHLQGLYRSWDNTVILGVMSPHRRSDVTQLAALSLLTYWGEDLH